MSRRNNGARRSRYLRWLAFSAISLFIVTRNTSRCSCYASSTQHPNDFTLSDDEVTEDDYSMPMSSSPPSSSSSHTQVSTPSFLVLATVDGSIWVLDAESGGIQSAFSSGEPLVGASTSLGNNRRIVPGLDGRLYVSTPISMSDDNEKGTDSTRDDDSDSAQHPLPPDQQQLQPLAITVYDVLENPIRTCHQNSKQNNDGDGFHEQQQECGILTATKATSLFALNTVNGHLMWYQEPNGQTTSTTVTTRSAPGSSTVLLQRQDVLVKQLSAESGLQVWNVTLGTLEALRFDGGEDDSASSFRASGIEDSLRLTSGGSKNGDFYDDDGVSDSIDDEKNSRPTSTTVGSTLPSVIFGPDGTTLAAVDPSNHGKVLWSQSFDAMVASAFGVGAGGWRSLDVVEGDVPLDEVKGGDEIVVLGKKARNMAATSSVLSGSSFPSRGKISEWHPRSTSRLFDGSQGAGRDSQNNGWWPGSAFYPHRRQQHQFFPDSTGVEFYRPPSWQSVLEGNRWYIARLQHQVEKWLGGATTQRIQNMVQHYDPSTQTRSPFAEVEHPNHKQTNSRSKSYQQVSLHMYNEYHNHRRPYPLMLPAPPENAVHRTSEGIFLTWKFVTAMAITVLVLGGLGLRWFYIKKKNQWIQLLARATAMAQANSGDKTISSDSVLLPPKNVSFAETITTPGHDTISRHENSDADPDSGLVPGAVQSTSLSSSTQQQSPPQQQQQQGVGMIAGIPLIQYSRYNSEFEEILSLGRGGFGTVVRCKNALDGREYAVKKVLIRHRQSRHEQQPGKEFTQRLQRVLREVKILALLDHPNIVRYYTAWLELEQGAETNGDQDRSSFAASTTRDYYLQDSITPTTTFTRRFSSNNLLAQDASSSTLGRRGYQSPSWEQSRGGASFDHNDISHVELDDLGFTFDRDSSSGNNEESSHHKMESKTRPTPACENIAAPLLSPDAMDGPSSSRLGLFFSPPSIDQSVSWSKEDTTKQKESAPLRTPNKSNKQQTPTADELESEDSVEPVLVRHTLYIQMQLCGQKTLADFLSNPEARRGSSGRDSVDIPNALSLFHQIAQGVSHVHEQGLIHRDLKPNNCFIDDSGVVKVGDFGLSRESGDKMVEEGGYTPNPNKAGEVLLGDGDHTAGVGTRSYASPEQMKGSDYDSSTDIYSLGLILFELCYPMYTGMERLTVFSKLRDQVFPEHWLKHTKPSFPTLHTLLVSMISNRQSERPSAEIVARTTQSILQEYTIQSLDKHHQQDGSLLLRVEATPREDVLPYTIELLKEVAAPEKVEIMQYGLRGGTNKAIMEFAISSSGSSNGKIAATSASALGSAIVSKMNQCQGIILVREVSASKSI